MVKLDDIYAASGDFLKADDLKGADPVEGVIKGSEIGEWPDGSRRFELIMDFGSVEKKFNCNKTNARRVAAMHGDDTDGWVGKSIIIFHDPTVEYGGEIKGGLRVKMPEAAPTGKKAAFLNNDNPAAEMPKDEIPF